VKDVLKKDVLKKDILKKRDFEKKRHFEEEKTHLLSVQKNSFVKFLDFGKSVFQLLTSTGRHFRTV
jgi:hypothetical protein